MEYAKKLKFHFQTKKGWINDPNGLVYFKGYYHIFYQHCPNCEAPWIEPMHWGHVRTKDFLNWEELPIALTPDREYDANGCWSGTAIVKDDILYLYYASVKKTEETDKFQSVSVAYSKDGIHFEKYQGNPVIPTFPADGGPDFRDPAVCCIGDNYYLIMAAGNPESQTARLLMYQSKDMFNWEYKGIVKEWEQCKYAECPSFMKAGDKFLLSASVRQLDRVHYFSIMYGAFSQGKFTAEYSAEVDKGPDQYAGQIFTDHLGRQILISWVPGWKYKKFREWDVGCMSVPREIKLIDGEIYGYPVKELEHLLTDTDPAVKRTENGFIIEREGREPVVYEGEIKDLKILRDDYIVEVFVNGGKEVYTAML